MKLTIEKEWVTKAGLVAKVVAYSDGGRGHRCGYVSVNRNSSIFNIEHICSYPNEAIHCNSFEVATLPGFDDSRFVENCDYIEGDKICHGGITFSQQDMINEDRSALILEPTRNGEHLWWFGFDCCHGFDSYDVNLMNKDDAIEYITKSYEWPPHKYPVRTLAYVESNCEVLAARLFELEQKGNKND
jgi:hypothetical protein